MARSRLKRAITVALTFAVALGTGFIVQYGDAVASRWGTNAPVGGPTTQSELPDADLLPVSSSFDLGLSLPLPQSVAPTLTNLPLSSIPSEEAVPAFDLLHNTPVRASDCSVDMDGGELKLAMVQLRLSAPCKPNSVVVIHHEGMVFSSVTDDAGSLIIDVPALSEDAFFVASFENGSGAIIQVDVPDITDYERAVLQWQGHSAVEIHAREFGADYGDDGHIWIGQTGDFAGAMSGINGLLTRLGEPSLENARMADVYTFPAGIAAQDGQVELTVEAEVQPDTCGLDVNAQTIQLRKSKTPIVIDLAMTLPPCDAVGEYLLLKNLFEDLTLAAR